MNVEITGNEIVADTSTNAFLTHGLLVDVNNVVNPGTYDGLYQNCLVENNYIKNTQYGIGVTHVPDNVNDFRRVGFHIVDNILISRDSISGGYGIEAQPGMIVKNNLVYWDLQNAAAANSAGIVVSGLNNVTALQQVEGATVKYNTVVVPDGFRAIRVAKSNGNGSNNCNVTYNEYRGLIEDNTSGNSRVLFNDLMGFSNMTDWRFPTFTREIYTY